MAKLMPIDWQRQTQRIPIDFHTKYYQLPLTVLSGKLVAFRIACNAESVYSGAALRDKTGVRWFLTADQKNKLGLDRRALVWTEIHVLKSALTCV